MRRVIPHRGVVTQIIRLRRRVFAAAAAAAGWEEDGGSATAAVSSPPRHRRSVVSSAPPPPLRFDVMRFFDLLIPDIAAPPRSTYYGINDCDVVHSVGDLSSGGARAPFRVHEQEKFASDPGLRFLLEDRSGSSNADLEAEREAYDARKVALVRQSLVDINVRTTASYHSGSANGVLNISGARGVRAVTNAWSMRACRPFSTAPPPEPMPPMPESPLLPSTHALEPIFDSEDRYRDSSSLYSCYNPLDFVKKYPVVQFVQLKDATTTKFDKYVLLGWFQSAARDLLKFITEHHRVDLELNAITLDKLVVCCNISASEFLPKFKVRCKIQKATDEGKMRNYQQAANVFKQLIDSSIDDPYLWALLSEDAKDWLHKLDNPKLSEAYLLVNHTCLLPIQLYSHFYLACYDQLMRAPKHFSEDIFSHLPYKSGDAKGYWQFRAFEHPLLRDHLLCRGANYGHADSEQGRYRRNVPSHKTEMLGPYSPEQVDRILHLHFEMTAVDLHEAMWRRKLTDELGLEKFFN
uniref:Uncharacterized protein n=1 Tax=Oryza punctata TaxID=4537 RepID=A0A0E0JVG3_ORYPU